MPQALPPCGEELGSGGVSKAFSSVAVEIGVSVVRIRREILKPISPRTSAPRKPFSPTRGRRVLTAAFGGERRACPPILSRFSPSIQPTDKKKSARLAPHAILRGDATRDPLSAL